MTFRLLALPRQVRLATQSGSHTGAGTRVSVAGARITTGWCVAW